MVSDFGKKNGGFTYIEVLMCLMILTLVIPPMSYAFLVTIKINREAIDIEWVTNNTEQLLEDVKYQMTQDIELQQKILGARYKIEGKSEAEIKKAKEGIGQYLVDGTKAFKEDGIRKDAELKEFLSSIGEIDLIRRYDLDKYAYQIALWRISDISWTNQTLTWDKYTLEKATKIYSDPSFRAFGLDKEGGVENRESVITFQITSEMLKIFQDDTFSYIPNQVVNEKILDKNRIRFDEWGVPEIIHLLPKQGAIDIQQCEILGESGTKIGYVFHIYESIMNQAEFLKDASKYRSIIEFDVRHLLRKNEDLSERTTYDSFTFKFINHTAYDQLIYIRKNVIETEKPEVVQHKFNVILEDENQGKSLMIQTSDVKPYENYLVAIVVRDKHPIQGQVGKVVKQMVDVYSYDRNKSK